MVSDLLPRDPPSVGPYRLAGRLGAGGMGVVYLARTAGGRLVAVKVIRPELAEEADFRERFRVEVEAARKVNGLFTAVVVDADVDGPVSWLATAYVPGPSLAEVVDSRGPLPGSYVLQLAAGLAEGLHAIHSAGVVHRDLKPSNVLLAADGPRVIDFGISRAMDGVSLTGPGMMVGSAGFMAPEQVTGIEVGPQSDMFNLGTVLTYASTGAGPFGPPSAPPHALLYRTLHGEPDLSGVPEEVQPIILACLAKDPRQRPTAAQLLSQLGSLDLGTDWLSAELLGEHLKHQSPEPGHKSDTSPIWQPTRLVKREVTADPPTVVNVVNPDTITTRVEFGQALAKVRQHAGLAVKEVAIQIDRPVSTVRAYFGGRSLPADREMLHRILTACGVPVGFDRWELALARVQAEPRPRRSRRTRPRAGEQPDLLLRVYIPSDRLYAAQAGELLTMFHDWLAARWPGIRRSGYRTASGETIEFFADAAAHHPPMRQEFDVFLNFLQLCGGSPAAAIDMLATTETDRGHGAELVTRFGKQFRRLQVDLRQERERRIMTLRHTLEAELVETGVDLQTISAPQIDSLLEDLVPPPSAPGWLPALTGRGPHLPPVNVTVHAGQVINAMAYTVIESVQGTVNLGAQAKELLALIDRFGGKDSGTLRTALHELEDPQAPPPARSAAKRTLKTFLSQLAGKLPDVALSLLEKYLESKLSIKG